MHSSLTNIGAKYSGDEEVVNNEPKAWGGSYLTFLVH